MEKKFQIYDLAVHKSAYVKYENALKEFFEKNKIYKDKDVEELYLPFLDLKELRSLVRFKNLRTLWLQSNQLKSLPFIQNCFSISEIYLQDNLIQSIEYSFRSLYNLSVIFLQGNQITSLNETANELSYLKHLKSLNLFNNPISLEKNYRSLVVHKIPSLEIFDRNTVKISDRLRAIKLYEPELLDMKKKRAFLRCNNLDKSKSAQKLNLHESFTSFNFSLSSQNETPYKYMKRNKTAPIDTNKINYLARSIKEYSFFDWSKVNLYENKKYFEEVKKQDSNDKKIAELPQIVTFRFA